MFDLKSLKPKPKKKAKRVGRGTSSGHGKTSGRGHKGQKSRSGGTKGVYFEGGQTPFYRRLPKKRGFKNYPFRTVYAPVNIVALNRFNSDVGISQFEAASLIKNGDKVKILGVGTLDKPLNVTAHAFSKKAKEIIEKAGGKAIKC
ncbi:50S ribosomal protein L15 [candidate division WOR-1 bacterium RIFOXYA2_FULL_36_21]|uniref:Large ribosomal subunit protein uL15 n=1 Tax=candidate division WOR-1 bacterium RIFOXYB2_FULL_36_35 TaxID=1802578 RepID=A0A1F4S510_UNCSA|nr:MAG: 50S ribosomal protein L15 [candidate division WOR-1 bacterium RIFOXYA2_FULL_36_21]OGC15515.1 MAG: 50S ribosomal protein L15 [candidate division WOR-1 bacterium RIFOXYB2_FULL_36_35]OGC21300.1 MAG: 50S ribosomal protein L15 [candidate division WOR-1 bacterium RIFOXYA12_FULL_36_13]